MTNPLLQECLRLGYQQWENSLQTAGTLGQRQRCRLPQDRAHHTQRRVGQADLSGRI